MGLLKKQTKQALGESDGELNLSPLIDIVFILLIFFIITTTFSRETGVTVEKPRANSTIEYKEDLIKVAVTREGSIHLFEKQVNLETLKTILSKEYVKNPKLKLVIVADRKSTTDDIISIIDRANQVGITSTSLATLKN